MNAWKRWQDWAAVGLGVIFFATPFVFGTDLVSAAAWTAYAGGALLIGSGIWSASTTDPSQGVGWIPLILGIAIVAAPWVLGYSTDPVMAWMSWIMGGLVVLSSGSELLFRQQPSPA